MNDNLPLIPGKNTQVCTDVRPVLREVFREYDCLPPLVNDGSVQKNVPRQCSDHSLPERKQWAEKYSSEYEEIGQLEGKLKQEYARRISREPLPNIYRLYSPESSKVDMTWKKTQGLIDRRDLIPSIEENATRNASLWIKNILNKSSCNVSAIEVKGSHLSRPDNIQRHDNITLDSLSLGEVIMRPPPPPPIVPPPPPPPEYIVCVPPELNFVNFTIGQLHTQSIRLVNVSKFEVRLSVRPPSRRELSIELGGTRGLTVTSGAAGELHVHFRPRDVRALRDEITVRVSLGKSFVVPIACYMQPPLLDVLVPNVSASALSCTPGMHTSMEMTVRSGDILDLGARLLGDVHYASLLLHCTAAHAAFFLLTEDAWLSSTLNELTWCGSVVAGGFVVRPAWWAGGGAAPAAAWCRAPHAGLLAAHLRLLSSTAVVRPLHIIADALHFKNDHVTIQAHEKDYDICSEDDPSCEYYVHLGTAFPHRSLAATVQLINHSPVTYTYYWRVRPWGVCSCWQDERTAEGSLLSEDDNSERLCPGARQARARGDDSTRPECVAVYAEPGGGRVAARSSSALHVRVTDAGARAGTRRAVLMLILKDIPKDSFAPGYDPMIVNTRTKQAEPIPGVKNWSYEVCEVVCAQLEVWWDVAPVRFVLDPPVLPLYHSRRLKSVTVNMRATQLFGGEGVRATWKLPANITVQPPTPQLGPSQSHVATMQLPLPELPNECPGTDVITLVADNNEWESKCVVRRWCATRHPQLRPQRAWLGVVTPGNHVNTLFEVYNDTYQNICWWCTGWRWWGESAPSPRCREPCAACRRRACCCRLLRPARGALRPGAGRGLRYDARAPHRDGCVVTLVRVRRGCARRAAGGAGAGTEAGGAGAGTEAGGAGTEAGGAGTEAGDAGTEAGGAGTEAGDAGTEAAGAGTEARAALVAYRVLAPRLVLRAAPCHGNNFTGNCKDCSLDESSTMKTGGTMVLRPKAALVLGHHTCYRLRITNITPLPTSVTWEAPLEAEDVLKVIFIPNNFDVAGYAELEVKVVLEARKVCGRRIYVYRANVEHAYKPMYLIIDTAIAGLEVVCQVPLGGGVKTGSFMELRRRQKEEFPWDDNKLKGASPEEIFEEDDRQRELRRENICHCRSKMVYIPPEKPRFLPQHPDDKPPIEIIWDPLPLTRVCACHEHTKPILPEYEETLCLQYRDLPIKTVRSRLIILRNVSVLTARWRACVRNWPRKHTRSLAADQWEGDVHAPGLVVECEPWCGVIGSLGEATLTVSVYADCWGLYRDQILIQIDKLNPIVLDLWAEVIAPPLQFALKPDNTYSDTSPVLWMSALDSEHALHVKNTSRSQLIVHAYVIRENEHKQDWLPFRLYLRFFDVPPRTCACVSAFGSDHLLGEDNTESSKSSIIEEMDTGIEIYIATDCGEQDNTYFKVEPQVLTVEAGAHAEWTLTLEPPEHEGEYAPPTTLLLRILPVDNAGPGWYRREPLPQAVKLRQMHREGKLQLSCNNVHIELCALDLPYCNVLRLRRRFRVQSIGNGPLNIMTRTEAPWCIVQNEPHKSGCGCMHFRGDRTTEAPIELEPRSSYEMCVEVCVETNKVWPLGNTNFCQYSEYKPKRITIDNLFFYDNDNILLTLPLILELDYPSVNVYPAVIDFGYVTDGDTRKTYFTISHTSRTKTLELVTHWEGESQVVLWPPYVRLPPHTTERVYVQYTAKACGAAVPAEGRAVARACGGAAAWCGAAVPVRAAASRDRKCHLPAHDHTDDPHLLPPHLHAP